VSLEEFVKSLNEWGRQRTPFLFIIDFEMKKPLAFRLQDVNPETVLYEVNGRCNNSPVPAEKKQLPRFEKFPPPFDDYKKKYESVRSRLECGDSYLTNLTIKTEVKTAMSLQEIYFVSKAKYKLLFKNHFLVFSPETFVRIADGKILAHPMKGTIDASVPDAESTVLADEKEMAEHVTIVDLIRNDLSSVATQVQVTRFRYVEEIRTSHKNLLQVSSEITGNLPADYEQQFGDILVKLLPAGSVSGAPKCKTMEIIRLAEEEERGYYTGVFGLYDGSVLDSGVMIRFMEWDGSSLYYRSGGGITVQSSPEMEYQEAIDKVYVPVD
jgi:para-aminobenzoate synthetase component 1